MSRINLSIVSWLVCMAIGASAPKAWAWGPEGHRAVAIVAQQVLTARSPQTLTALKPILGTATLAAVAVCPDELRSHDRDPRHFQYSPACLSIFGSGGPANSANWHFVDLNVAVPLPASDLTLDQQYCQQDDCVIARILSFERVLTTTGVGTAGDRLRALQALSFVVHFVGDLHQPLHAAERNNDHGGNDVTVSLRERGRPSLQTDKLHGAWDGVFINNVAGNEVAFVNAIAAFVADALKEPVPAAAQFSGWVHTWARQSEQLASQRAYRDQNQPLPTSGHVLSAAYESSAEAVVKQQVATAGVRLAAVLAAAMKGR